MTNIELAGILEELAKKVSFRKLNHKPLLTTLPPEQQLVRERINANTKSLGAARIG